MKHLASVEFIFENVESMEFDAKYFGSFHIDRIGRAVKRFACNAILDYTMAKEVAIEIFSEANDTYAPFGDESESTTKFERIMEWDDITRIVLKYEDGSYDELFVDYDEGEDECKLGAENINQKSMLSDLGNLYIVIAHAQCIEDWFDDKEINSEDLIHDRKRMQDVCEKNAHDLKTEEYIRKMMDENSKE